MALFSKISQVLTTDLTKEFKLKNNQFELEKSFVDAIRKCQSIEILGKKVHFSQNYLSALILEAIKSCPSIQSVNTLRYMIVYNTSHQTFWNLVEQEQRQHIPQHLFEANSHKIQNYKDALGTLLLFEDQSALQQLGKKFPLQAEHHSAWSTQSLGMTSLAVWSTLADMGLGVNQLQYVGVDQRLQQQLNVPLAWKIKSQLVFGSIEQSVQMPEMNFEAEHCLVLN